MSDLPTSHRDSPEHPVNRRKRVAQLNTLGTERIAQFDGFSESTYPDGETHRTVRFQAGEAVNDLNWFRVSAPERFKLGYNGLVLPA